MNTIIFHNPGLIPLDAIRLMGASVKAEGSFGRFGTGFKYAVATILRGGGIVTVWRGEDLIVFSTRDVDVKGSTFAEVWMDYAQQVGTPEEHHEATPLGFTTLLGKDWEPWMALRELACNARDEGGDWALVAPEDLSDFLPPKVDGPVETVVMVDWPEMEAAAQSDGEHVFAPEGEVLLEERGVRVLPGPSNYLYHRGVRVWKLPKPSVFTYDITAPVELTEDRTVKYAFCVVANVRNMILQTGDRTIIAATVAAKKETWESGFDWSGQEWSSVDPGQVWLDEVAGLRENSDSWRSSVDLSKSATDVMFKHRAFKETTHSSSWSSYDGVTEGLSYASEVLNSLDMSVDEVEIYITKMLPNEALSAINNGRIYLAERLLDMRASLIARELIRRQLELQSGGDHDVLLGYTVDRLFKLATRNDGWLKRDWEKAEEEAEKVPAILSPGELDDEIIF